MGHDQEQDFETDKHCLELIMVLVSAARRDDKSEYRKTRKIIRGLILEDEYYRRFFEEVYKVSSR